MIEVYKFFNNIYDSATTRWLTDKHMQIYDMRVHRHSLYQSQIWYDIRKYSFSNIIIPLWNSLPEKVVSSSTVKSLKVQLDRFWANEEIYYDYKTNISCTGSRSNYDVDLEWFLLLKFMCKYCIFTMDWTSRQAMLRPHWTILLLLLLLAVLALSQSPIEGLHITHYSPLPPPAEIHTGHTCTQ